jgi:hypothetical protein
MPEFVRLPGKLSITARLLLSMISIGYENNYAPPYILAVALFADFEKGINRVGSQMDLRRIIQLLNLNNVGICK